MGKLDPLIIFLIVVWVIVFIIVIFMVGFNWNTNLSQETLNDICINLSQNETAIGEVQSDGTLTCTIPSFDSTLNIVIKQGGQDG